MDINNLTLGQIKEIQALLGSDLSQNEPSPFEVGQPYLIRTVTMIYTGRVVACYRDRVVLEDPAWIPETARWNECLTKGIFNEVEPYPGRVTVWFGGMIDHCEFDHTLPREPK